MEITKENMVYFKFCSDAVKNGCKNSRDLEKELFRKFWEVYPLQAERIVKTWFTHREKIDRLIPTFETLKPEYEDYIKVTEPNGNCRKSC
jgi:hypothetical protein